MTSSWKAAVRRALGIAGAGALFGTAAYVAFELAARVRSEPAAVVPAQAPAAAGAPADARPPSMRELIQRAIAEAQVKDAAQLERYFAQLEAQARGRGSVTALDIEPGIAVAAELGAAERAQAFSERMRALQRALQPSVPGAAGVAGAVAPAAPGARLGSELARIVAASGDEREALIRRYRDVAERLPEAEELLRLAELNAALARVDTGVSSADADSLWRGIETAPDAATRNLLIREYTELVSGLPEDEELRRLAELNRRFGAPIRQPGPPQ